MWGDDVLVRLRDLWPVWKVLLLVIDTFDVKELNELLVHGPRLGVREGPVFVKDRGVAPALEFSQAAHETPCSVLPLITMDQNGVVPHIWTTRQ